MLFPGSIRSHHNPGEVLDKPGQLAKLWSRHLPHPRCPAARMFDSSSLRLAHPESPAARYIEWSSGVLPHPNSPAGRSYLWADGRNATDHSTDSELAHSRLAVEASLDKHSDSLRETLPDTGLRAIYDRQMGLLKESYGFMKSFSIIDPARVLHEVQRQIGWVHCHLQGTLTGSYYIAVGSILSELNLVQAQPIDGDNGKLLSHIQSLSELYYQAAIGSIQEHLAQASNAGKQEELIQRWRARMLACAAGGAGGALESPVEAPPPPQRKPPKNSDSSGTKVKTWIAIRLLDEDGNPVPDVAYSVTLPDGSVMTGSLDNQGLARFDDIDPGQCQVSFPEIHAKEWKGR
jgi:hypothetical protein